VPLRLVGSEMCIRDRFSKNWGKYCVRYALITGSTDTTASESEGSNKVKKGMSQANIP
jgi:hypothetical protein